LRGPSSFLHTLTLLPDGKTLLSGGPDGAIYAWDTTPVRHDPALPRFRDVSNWQFSSDSRAVLVVDGHGHVSQWEGLDLQVKQPVVGIGGEFTEAEFSKDARLLAVGSADGAIRIWDLVQGGPPRQLPRPGKLLKHSFVADTEQLFFCDVAKQRFNLWDLNSFREIRSWDAPVAIWSAPTRINASAISNDGKRALAVSWNGKVFLEDIAEDCRLHWELGIVDVVDVAISLTGKLFAVASLDGYAQIWEIASQHLLATVNNQPSMWSVTFSPNGTRLMTTRGGAKALTLWDMQSQRELWSLDAEGGRFGVPRFSPDGCLLGCQNSEGVLYIWRAPSRAEIEAADKAKL
jgi:WD40 repeat protein